MTFSNFRKGSIFALSFVFIVLFGINSCKEASSDSRAFVNEARGVVERTFGTFPKNVVFKAVAKSGDYDSYTQSVSNGRLTIEGTSPVAICKGFHDYIVENGYGIASWSGNRLDLPASLPDMESKTVTSPYKHHLFYNVCTYGYTGPFYGWKEWEKQIDWLALHGFDMPLAPIGGETILAKVFAKIGLSKEEIDEYFTGPAFFPWMRMGNIAGYMGGMSDEWYEQQISLAHKIDERHKALGMTPVYQGFAGFVPRALKKHYPEASMTETIWSSFESKYHSYILSQVDPLFGRIGSEFIREWEKEFGKGKYYLVDSFNELDIPFGEKGSKERADVLHNYGKVVYNSIAEANPDAVWVMQGWIFGHQRNIWDPESVKALLSGAPDGKMMIIDLAVDSNEFRWKSAKTWDYLDGLFGKDWIWSTTPNYGGRSTILGPIDFYLNAHTEALDSPNKGNLVGYGTSPEGIENNEIIFEAISSAGWRPEKTDLYKFLDNYSVARYGKQDDNLKMFWREMQQWEGISSSIEGRFIWQGRPGSGLVLKMQIDDHYYKSIEHFLAASDNFKGNKLYETDAIMYAAMYLSAKAENVMMSASGAIKENRMSEAKELETTLLDILGSVDRLLESHPLLRTEKWMKLAAAAGTNPEESRYFVLQAKKLISIWGGEGLYDYSARVWSGLIRDYYMPRIKHYFDTLIDGGTPDMRKFDENLFYPQPGLSPVEPYEDPVASAKTLVAKYSDL
jgi:hypothetical protein